MRRCLAVRKRLALRRRYKQRVLKTRHLQLVNEAGLSESDSFKEQQRVAATDKKALMVETVTLMF